MKTIVVVNDFGYVNGGAAQVALVGASLMAGRGYDVRLFCGAGPVADFLTADGIKAICLNHHEIAKDANRLRAMGRGLWNGEAAREFDRLLDTLSADQTVIHVHGWTKVLSSSVVATAVRRGFPVAISLHDYFVACPNGGFFDFQKNEICERHALSADCLSTNCDVRNYVHKTYRVARQMVQIGPGQLPRGVRHFIYHSPTVRDRIRPYLSDDAILHPMPMPIDMTRQPAVPVASNRNIVMVGRMSPEKGAELFAEASARAGVQAVLVGEGDTLASAMARNPTMRATGWLDRAALSAELQQARALVFPSLCQETFGLAVMEAAALGIPSIVSGRAAAADLIRNGSSGLLFETGSVSDLAEKLVMLADDDRTGNFGQAAYEDYWRNPMTHEVYANALSELYAGLRTAA